ncbi:HAD family hydrolase [Pseudazoarcus pumilus]|uniref:Phosphoglycolate phosphatase n=1 Tax=Pseudazoarcus pumilus TaxID=2067960 RepID=A0A2I6S5W9_9RHOO|nr:HAD-IA family hydrolase [Pseudazoarcus pumilus]AUN94646.1 hypothetical protein C0099_06665 [Pseudazoarcus pumilus]
MLNKTEYSAVIFDLDGTLVDTLPDLHGALIRALTDVGLPEIPENVVKSSLHGGLEASTAAAIVWLEADQLLYEPLLNSYRGHYRGMECERSRAFDGVPEMLHELNDSGVALGVCTNKAGRAARALLQHLELAQYFKTIVGADSCTRRKPDPMPLDYAVRLLDVSHERVLYVGDSIVDYECAKAAGIEFRLYGGGYGAEEVLHDKSVKVINDYSAISA